MQPLVAAREPERATNSGTLQIKEVELISDPSIEVSVEIEKETSQPPTQQDANEQTLRPEQPRPIPSEEPTQQASQPREVDYQQKYQECFSECSDQLKGLEVNHETTIIDAVLACTAYEFCGRRIRHPQQMDQVIQQVSRAHA